jgi:phosphoribosylformylglycinamidine synthase
MRINVIMFPGSNCDGDAFHISKIRGHQVEYIWHKDSELKNPDMVFLPGGFSYGDYLRCGAIAKHSPIIQEVIKFANQGGLVIGVCNGFQILTETGLLPGALMRNQHLDFVCKHQYIRVETTDSPFTCEAKQHQVLDIPIAHKEGNYFIDADGLKSLQDNNQIIFRYSTEDGFITPEANPNGALDNIAGICNIGRNVLGMMPHPERAAEDMMPSIDGKIIFASIEKFMESR